MTAKYMVYIPSKGRAEMCLTAEHMRSNEVPFTVVVEPQEEKAYRARHGKDNVTVMPENDQGIAYARRFIKEHSRAKGEEYHWQMDDDIKTFMVREGTKNVKRPPTGLINQVEDYVQRHVNIGIGALKQDTWAWSAKSELDYNKLACAAILVNNRVEGMWRDDVVEDVDYSMQVLLKGWCITTFNRLIFCPMPTGTTEGGNQLEGHYDRYGQLIRNLGKYYGDAFKVKVKNGKERMAPSNVWGTFKQRPIEKTDLQKPSELNVYQKAKLEDLVEDPNNARTHNEANKAAIRASLLRFGQVEPLVVRKGTNVVVGGNGRMSVMKSIGWKEADVREVSLTDSEARALSIALNRSGELAAWDEEALMENIRELKNASDFNLEEMTALDLGGITFEEMLDEQDKNDASLYTRDIVLPIYEPKGERPSVESLTDTTKRDQLVNDIKSSGLPEEVKNFLASAAERHTVFDFSKIAEYYAHADIETQELMERSALVIIDHKKAIENGFIHLTKKMSMLVQHEKDIKAEQWAAEEAELEDEYA
jgi:hypothetical protein